MPQLAKKKDCTGCLACMDACKHNAISTVMNDGHIYVMVDNDKCINCGLCEKSCPERSLERKNNFSMLKVYGGWCTNYELRKKAASGGAFAGLAVDVLKRGGVVIGASLQGDEVKHLVVERVKDLPLLLNSKYVQSRTDGIFQKVKVLLKDDRLVLFSGTPCQVAALYCFLSNKSYDKLITVDLICTGVPSREAVGYHLREYNGKAIVSYRDKQFPDFITFLRHHIAHNDNQRVT